MFTLKLYRRSGYDTAKITHKVLEVDHVVVHAMTEPVNDKQSLEIQAFYDAECRTWDVFYVGEPSKGMEAFGKKDLHLHSGCHSWWGWGLLENAVGKTTEHYRPGSYG